MFKSRMHSVAMLLAVALTASVSVSVATASPSAGFTTASQPTTSPAPAPAPTYKPTDSFEPTMDSFEFICPPEDDAGGLEDGGKKKDCPPSDA